MTTTLPIPEPPIVHVDGDDVTTFLTVVEAESYTEAYDVDVGVFYDSRGRVLRAFPPPARGIAVGIELPADFRLEPMALASALRRDLAYLASIKPRLADEFGITPEWAAAAALEDLTMKSAEVEIAWRNRPRLLSGFWRKFRRSPPPADRPYSG